MGENYMPFGLNSSQGKEIAGRRVRDIYEGWSKSLKGDDYKNLLVNPMNSIVVIDDDEREILVFIKTSDDDTQNVLIVVKPDHVSIKAYEANSFEVDPFKVVFLRKSMYQTLSSILIEYRDTEGLREIYKELEDDNGNLR